MPKSRTSCPVPRVVPAKGPGDLPELALGQPGMLRTLQDERRAVEPSVELFHDGPKGVKARVSAEYRVLLQAPLGELSVG